MNLLDILRLTRVSDTITVFSLSLGFSGIVFVFEQHLLYAAVLVIICALLDGVDGVIARFEDRVTRKFGAMLDSFSDGISFCVLPAIIIYALTRSEWVDADIYALDVMLIVCALYVAFGMMRLARFNILEATGFVGIPTTGAGMIMTTMVIIELNIPAAISSTTLPVFNLVLLALLSLLMISDIPYPKPTKKPVLAAFSLLPIALIVSSIIGHNLLTVVFGAGVLTCLLLYVLSPVIPWIERGIIDTKGDAKGSTNTIKD